MGTDDDQGGAASPQPTGPVILSVLGSVCGTLVASVPEGTSPTVKLVGATVGAAIPPLIAVAGPHARLRAFAAVLVAGAALLVTYGGFLVTDTIFDRPATFPEPFSAADEPTSPATTTAATKKTPSPTTTGTGPPPVCEGAKCIATSAPNVHCSRDGCGDPLEISNPGSVELRLRDIELTGERAQLVDLQHQCAQLTLAPGDTCPITIRLAGAAAAGQATLVVHQDLKGPATEIPIVIDGPATDADGPDLVLFALPECYTIPNGQLSGADGLTVQVAVRNAGPGTTTGLVPYTIVSDTGLTASGSSALSTGPSSRTWRWTCARATTRSPTRSPSWWTRTTRSSRRTSPTTCSS